MSAQTDEHFMQQALLLAERGLYTTHPNPRVGCVLVREGRVVGEGWHQQAGGPHAEIIALTAADLAAKGATCYVTLEPCCHQGKTPPCVPALIKAGVRRVVIATLDPNPLVFGKSVQALKQAGLAVSVGVLSEASQRLNQGFFKRMQHQRPYIRCKFGMSLDGRIAAANGKSQWITGEKARQDVQHWRAQSSGILTGINTILADNPRLSVRAPPTLTLPHKGGGDKTVPPSPCARGLGGGVLLAHQPLRIILDTHLRTPLGAAVFAAVPPFEKGGLGGILIFTNCKDASKINAFEKMGAKVVHTTLFGGRLDLSKIFTALATQFEQNEILVEAGSTLAGALLSEGWVDELIFYVAPKILGNLAHPLFDLPQLRLLEQAIALEIREVSQCGEDWRIIAHPGA